jgi:hypothetical protein
MCETTNLNLAKGTPSKVASAMNSAWQAVAADVGCQTSRPPQLTANLSVAWLDSQTGQAAVVGNLALPELGSVVVHPESFNEFESLWQADNVIGVRERTSTGIGDFQVFLAGEGTCQMNLRASFADSPTTLSDSQTVATLEVARRFGGVVEQLGTTASGLTLKLVNPEGETVVVGLNSFSAGSVVESSSPVLSSVDVPQGAPCAASSVEYYEAQAAQELTATQRTTNN